MSVPNPPGVDRHARGCRFNDPTYLRCTCGNLPTPTGTPEPAACDRCKGKLIDGETATMTTICGPCVRSAWPTPEPAVEVERKMLVLLDAIKELQVRVGRLEMRAGITKGGNAYDLNNPVSTRRRK